MPKIGIKKSALKTVKSVKSVKSVNSSDGSDLEGPQRSRGKVASKKSLSSVNRQSTFNCEVQQSDHDDTDDEDDKSLNIDEIDARLNALQKFMKESLHEINIGHVIVFEFIALAGLAVAVVGYRFLKLAMFAAGFVLAFAAFYVFSPRFIDTKYCCTKRGMEEVHIGSSVLAGIVAGLFTVRLYKVGIFLIGKCLGLLAALLILQSPLGGYFKSYISIASLLATSAVMFGSLACKYEKCLAIMSTSFLGSYVAVCGVDIFVKSAFSFTIYGFMIFFANVFDCGIHSKWNIDEGSLPHLQLSMRWLTKKSLIMLGCWLALSSLCCLLQYRLTAKDLKEGGSICPFDFYACICGCCKRGKEEKQSKERETVYFYLDGESWKEDVKNGKKRCQNN
eukprot:Seg1525.3 transcript_id=Seg1525.3/GoldUCD/mRNA.D3Y31 product="Transmembrane protein 198" protein_id=Seg1525.3/GoldUCD/D3Y31